METVYEVEEKMGNSPLLICCSAMETVYEVEEKMGNSPLLICCSAMENVYEVEGKIETSPFQGQLLCNGCCGTDGYEM